LRILFGNLYTEVSDSNLKLPDDAKLIWLSIVQQCDQIVWYHYYSQLNNFRLEYLPYLNLVDFAYYAAEDFTNVARIQANNYNFEFYKNNRIEKLHLRNPPDRYVTEKFGAPSTKTQRHLTIRSDIFYKSDICNEMLITRTGLVPRNCPGIESSYVISDKLHFYNPTTLTFQNPNLTFWHLCPEHFMEYNTKVWEPAKLRVEKNYLKENLNSNYFTQRYFPCDVSIILIDSLIQSNHPHLSNPLNLNSKSLKLIEFWTNQKDQFRPSFHWKLNSNSEKVWYELHRNHVCKLRLKSATLFEETLKIIRQNSHRLRIK
jgi:hypothetical protein